MSDHPQSKPSAPQFDPDPPKPTAAEQKAADKAEASAEAARPLLHADNEQDRVEPIVDHGPPQDAGPEAWGQPGRAPDIEPDPKAKK